MLRTQQLALKNTGVALITVLLVVALATTAAVAMASRQHIDIRRTENSLFSGQSAQYQLGVEAWSKQFLNQDSKDNKVDHKGEDWAKHLPPLPVDGGTVRGYINDLQGRFNLNNLQPDNKNIEIELQRFKRLLRILEINEDLSGLIQDWIDPDQDARPPSGAEDVYYLGLPSPYRTSNQLIQSTSELLLLKEFKREDYQKLLPHITALPQITAININTTTPEILQSLHNDLTSNELMAIIEKDRKYDSVEEFLKEPVFHDKKIPVEGLDVRSDYFMLYSEINIGHITKIMESLFERDEKGMIKTLVRSEGNI
ncbi:MAG: type II secretion system minor pseudopilin GspK [Gammaproteobacteria bacterium]|nr:type II secretion system minor pseudopilin GspK [Gammaproteobacteria bacterium]